MKDRLQILLDYTNLHELICDALRDLAPFVQFKKREKRPWKSVKSNTASWVFFTFFKLYKW